MAISVLIDWLVTGYVIDQPGALCPRPEIRAEEGQDPGAARRRARALLDAIPDDTMVGLRDRALIGVMVYIFAPINAVLEMKVKDNFV